MIADGKSIFDLLEAMAVRFEARGFDASPLRAAFARETQGVDIDFIVDLLAGPPPLKRPIQPLGIRAFDIVEKEPDLKDPPK